RDLFLGPRPPRRRGTDGPARGRPGRGRGQRPLECLQPSAPAAAAALLGPPEAGLSGDGGPGRAGGGDRQRTAVLRRGPVLVLAPHPGRDVGPGDPTAGDPRPATRV